MKQQVEGDKESESYCSAGFKGLDTPEKTPILIWKFLLQPLERIVLLREANNWELFLLQGSHFLFPLVISFKETEYFRVYFLLSDLWNTRSQQEASKEIILWREQIKKTNNCFQYRIQKFQNWEFSCTGKAD